MDSGEFGFAKTNEKKEKHFFESHVTHIYSIVITCYTYNNKSDLMTIYSIYI